MPRKEICPHCRREAPPSPPTIRLNVEMDAELYEEVKRDAIARRKNLSQVVREMFEQYKVSHGGARPRKREAVTA